MGLNKKDIEMMCIAIPVVDYFEMREDLDRLEDAINHLEKNVEVLAELYLRERVKNWELILKEMLDRKGVKKEGKTFIKPIFKMDTSEVGPSEFEEEQG